MKKLYILSSIALAAFMTSCYDLDTQPMSSSITEDQRDEIIELDEAKITGLSDGIYKYYNEFGWFGGDYYDFGYPAIMLQLDSRTADFISANADLYGWFSACAEYLDNTANNGYNAIRWGLPYGIIYAANQLIDYVSEDQKEDLFYQSMLGQAYGNRAFAYWFLAQLYQFNYAYTAPDGVPYKEKMCVPLITEKNMAKVAVDGAPRASVEEIYTQILDDLTTGIDLLEGNPYAVRADRRYIDADVLYALRARTYLCMQDYANAAADAQRVISSSNFHPLSAQEAIGPGFNSITSTNWVWGIYYYIEDTIGLYTLPGMMGSYTYGYAYAGMWKCITDRLYDEISSNDPRKLWWINPVSGVSNANYYTDAVLDTSVGASNAAEYLQACGFPGYAVTKFAPYQNQLGQSNNQSDIPLIRIEEMYLILAEALGEGEKANPEGISTLENFINDYRWLDSKNPYSFANVQSQTGRTFMEEIFLQREIELWGEGMTYFDILRLNLSVDRADTNWEDPTFDMDAYAYNIPAGSPVLIMQIPTSELDNNPALSAKDQNAPGSAN